MSLLAYHHQRSKLLKNNFHPLQRSLRSPKVPRHSELKRSLNTSSAYETSSASFVNAGNEEPDAEEVERIRSILEETNKCYLCEYRAPVPWVHPSKGVNLSGMDIWDLGGQKKVNGLLDWSLFLPA